MINISIIIPIFNGEKWINRCMTSISKQTLIETDHQIEIVTCDDGSKDGTLELLRQWKNYFDERKGVTFVIVRFLFSRGVGAAKNYAVRSSSGEFLCFQDIDDVMQPERLRLQLETAQNNRCAIVGSKIKRVPAGSTPRFESWANELQPEQLYLQIYTSHGPTLLMPTWFCHRSVYDRVGGFNESGCGTPEDLLFFYAHLDTGGHLLRVDEELVLYTYHVGSATFSVSRECIWQLRVSRLEKYVLPNWHKFTVWNAGRHGRRFVRSLSYKAQSKVQAFCDVDVNKIGRVIQLYCPVLRKDIRCLPVLHFSEAEPPFIICVKLNMTNGEFEKNLESLNLIEGKDYILFS